MQKARRHPLPDSDRLQANGFRVFSLPCLGFFSPFLHSTGSLSVSQQYLALPDGAGIFRQNFSGSALLIFQLIILSHTGLSPSTVSLPRLFRSLLLTFWATPLSLATTYGITIVLFSSGYLDVSVLRVILSRDMSGLQPDGLPHSDIYGSTLVCNSPQLFAAYHVLRRL